MARVFTFNCFLDSDDGHNVWCGGCHELGIHTEGRSYNALVKRIWQIAPEMAVLNKFVTREDEVELHFITEMTAPNAYIVAAE